MTVVSPHWATWSLQSISSETNFDVQKPRLPSKDEDKAALSTFTEKGGLALFSQSSKDNIYDSQWQDFDQEGEQEHNTTAASLSDAIVKQECATRDLSKEDDHVDVKALFEHVKSLIQLESRRKDDNHPSTKIRYDPLTNIESRFLLRALKLSNFIPPSAQELEEERRVLASAKVELTSRINVDDAGDKRKTENRINLETGKRIYGASTRGTGLIRKENEEAKEVLRAMCKQMLPKRDFDWILAQLTYNVKVMLRFDEEVPSARGLIRDKAIKSVKDQSVPIEHLAHVITLLAEASKVDTSQFEIIDPTKKARSKGRSLGYVRSQMLAQSKAIFDVMRCKLFPEMFNDLKREVGSKPSKVEEDTQKDGLRQGNLLDDGTTETLKDEMGPTKPREAPCIEKASWQSIFPQMSQKMERRSCLSLEEVARRKEKENFQGLSITDAQSFEDPPLLVEEGVNKTSSSPKVLKRQAGMADVGVKRKKSRLAQREPANQAQTPVDVLTGVDALEAEASQVLTKTRIAPLQMSTKRSSRSSTSSECGDFKLPLPPFWAKTKTMR